MAPSIISSLMSILELRCRIEKFATGCIYTHRMLHHLPVMNLEELPDFRRRWSGYGVNRQGPVIPPHEVPVQGRPHRVKLRPFHLKATVMDDNIIIIVWI